MIEDADNLVTLKISERDKEWILDEQRRLHKSEAQKPSHAAIFARLRECYESALKDHIVRPTLENANSAIKKELLDRLARGAELEE